ncbi:MAG TPA: PKD domain-containing protein [Chitinophagales bacterium]|nr:PKD domain-containing protein [Chitinophagales bacterium]
MKKTKLRLIAVAMTLLAIACKKEDNSPKPVANFNITSNDTLNMDQEFSFTNTSTGATSYTWDFADGTSATTVNATKTYEFDNALLINEFNTISVKLTARDDAGHTSVSTKNIVVTTYL